MSTERRPRRTPAHLLAPIALIVFGIAVLLVLSSGGGSSGDSGASSSNAAAEKRDLGSAASRRKERRKQRTTTTTTSTTPTGDVYVVKQGDTLAGIAQKTGVTVERLQELNPGLDQFSLVAGQRIKLR
jgi:LysM repeat protein